MKKLLSLLAIAAVMCVGLAGNALAYFETGNLIRVVYQTDGTNETLTDLGDWATLSGAAPNTVVGPAINMLGTTYANLRVAYYVVTNAVVYDGMPLLSGPVGSAPISADAPDNVQPLYDFVSPSGAVTQTVTRANNTPASYIENMNYGAVTGSQTGTFNGYFTTGNGEASLAALTGAGTYVDMVLYSFADPFAIQTGVAEMTIRTLADGTTQLNPGVAAVPVPGAVLLFGSGLLGLFGIRRKNNQV